eukprot:1194604-Prorocentrum_minimum.AAC.4
MPRSYPCIVTRYQTGGKVSPPPAACPAPTPVSSHGIVNGIKTVAPIEIQRCNPLLTLVSGRVHLCHRCARRHAPASGGQSVSQSAPVSDSIRSSGSSSDTTVHIERVQATILSAHDAFVAAGVNKSGHPQPTWATRADRTG